MMANGTVESRTKLTGSIFPAAYLDELLDVGDLLRHCDG
jgi:hypothetical protein